MTHAWKYSSVGGGLYTSWLNVTNIKLCPVTTGFMIQVQGPIVTLLTPFDRNGDIDWQAFKRYLASLYSWGVGTVIANGTTAEFASLTIDERRQVIEFVRKHFAGTIINNVSATCVKDVRELIDETQDRADLLLILPPYYYSAREDNGLCRFFSDALSETPLPAMLYHFPQHTGNFVGVDLVAMLLDRGISIQGIKDSSGDLDNALLYRSNFPGMPVFLGNDEKAFEVLQKGLTGSVTGAANPLPELLITLQAEFRSCPAKAQSIQRCLDTWNAFRQASGHPEIPLVKAAMGARIAGFPPHVRAPFMPIPNAQLDQIRTVIHTCLNDFQRLVSR